MNKYCIVFILLQYLTACSRTTVIQNSDGSPIRESIAEMTNIQIGGQKQFMLIRSVNTDNPVLLFLHGGPGSPETGLVRHYHSELEKYFTIVLWEQRGSGKTYSNGKSIDSNPLEQFIQDTHEVSQYLKTRFNKKKILIVGHSWGSYLGLPTAARYPNDFFAVVCAGLLVNTVRQEEISYNYALSKATEKKNEKAIEELKKIGPPENGIYKAGIDGLFAQRNWLTEFGGSIHKMEKKSDFMKKTILADEYSFLDSLNYIRGVFYSLNAFFPVYNQSDLLKEVPKINIPIFFLSGKYDFQTPVELSKEYFDFVNAPLKKWVVFENSAHMQIYEESEKYVNFMINEIRILEK